MLSSLTVCVRVKREGAGGLNQTQSRIGNVPFGLWSEGGFGNAVAALHRELAPKHSPS